MNIREPFHPVACFLHAILGVTGVLCAIVALSVSKGSFAHRSAGMIFVVAATVAAATAIAFGFSAFAPMAIASAGMSISAIGSALLALRQKSWGITAADFVFLNEDDVGRRSKRLPRHLSRMAFAFTIAVHSPIVVLPIA